MRLFSAVFLFLAIASISYATTLEEVAHLSKLNTSDDLILQLLQENPVKTSVGPADVIFLKEQGVSEQVIGYIWTAAKSEKAILPPQDGESISLGEGLRGYYVLTDDGQRKMVVTNLDENGMRMGPLPPLPSKETAYAERMQQESAPVDYSGQYEIPRQVYYDRRLEIIINRLIIRTPIIRRLAILQVSTQLPITRLLISLTIRLIIHTGRRRSSVTIFRTDSSFPLS